MLVKDIKSAVNRTALCSDFDTSICMIRVSEGIEIQLSLNILLPTVYFGLGNKINFRLSRVSVLDG